MRNRILTGITALILLTGVASLLLVTPATGSTNAAKATKLTVAMHDPGCHWFYTGGGPNNRNYAKTAVRTGPVKLLNLDEATLIVKGPSGASHVKVGATQTLTAKGVYTITMVKQAPDDNHLKLTIK